MLSKLRNIYREFPSLFWIIVAVRFVDGIGSTLLFPFFALYITQKFDVGMTQAGVMLGMSSLFGLIGNMAGGALTDRFGRRQLILFGLVFSALSSLSLGLVTRINLMYPLIMFVGLLSNISHPAHEAMIADILPDAKRQEGFGILRVVGNLAWIIGPTIGGFVANINFFYLFVIDSVISVLLAVVIYRLLPETKPAGLAHEQSETFLQTIAGYRHVMRDRAFMAFILTGIVMLIVYQQMYGSFSVYLRDVHGINPQGYGILMSTSAITVVLLQFTVTRMIKRRPPFLMMAFGTFFYMLGFTLIGVVATLSLFGLCIIIITVGEMIVVPTSQALVAGFAPEDMRGRYMAVSGLSWAIPSTIGPGAAGYILDNYNPSLLWFVGGALCGISVVGYYLLHMRLGAQKRFTPHAEEAVIPAAAD